MADPTNAFLSSLFSGGGAGRGDPGLDAFSRTLGQNDFWKIGGSSLLTTPLNTTTWSPATALGVTAAKSFLGAFLGGYGQSQEAEQLNKVNAILPQLYADPSSITVPDGVDPEAFAGLKASAIRDNFLRGNKLEDLKNSAIAELFTSDAKKKLDLKYAGAEAEAKKAGELSALGTDVPGSPTYEKGQDTKKLEKDYYDKIVNLPQYKLLADVDSNFKALTELSKQDSKAADIGLISTIARIRDPNSTVREGEYKMNAETQSYLDQVAGNWRQTITGDSRLQPFDKAKIIASVAPKYNELGSSYATEKAKLIDALRAQNGDPSHVPALEFSPFDISSLLGKTNSVTEFASQAKALGLSKDEARARWNMLNGQ